MRKSVNAAIATLPRQFGQALLLRDVDDLPYEDIAKIMKSDLGTVKSRIARGRVKVQVLLRPEFRPERAA